MSHHRGAFGAPAQPGLASAPPPPNLPPAPPSAPPWPAARPWSGLRAAWTLAGTVALTALLAGAGVSTAGGGLPLADPTRPPLAAAVVVVPAAAKATTALRATPPPALPPPHVQALKLPQSGGASALVDGYWVNVGDLLQGRRVLAIDAAGLLWQGAVGDQRVPLLGGTPKQAPGSIVLNRSAGYVPSATPDSSAKGLAGGTPGMAPGTGTAATPDGGPGPGQDKEQPLSVARRNSR